MAKKSSLGERIRALRVKRGMTAEQLARALKRSVGTVFCWEWDKQTPRNVRQLEAIAAALGVSLAELLADEPKARSTAPPPAA